MYWFCSPTMKLPRQLGKKLWLVEGVFTKWSPLTPDLDPLSRYNDTTAPVLNLLLLVSVFQHQCAHNNECPLSQF